MAQDNLALDMQRSNLSPQLLEFRSVTLLKVQSEGTTEEKLGTVVRSVHGKACILVALYNSG